MIKTIAELLIKSEYLKKTIAIMENERENLRKNIINMETELKKIEQEIDLRNQNKEPEDLYNEDFKGGV